jgi:hypothetical protein
MKFTDQLISELRNESKDAEELLTSLLDHIRICDLTKHELSLAIRVLYQSEKDE